MVCLSIFDSPNPLLTLEDEWRVFVGSVKQCFVTDIVGDADDRAVLYCAQ